MKKIFIILFIFLFLFVSAPQAFAASPSRIGTDTIFSSTGTSHTAAHTVPSTGQNRALIVIIFHGWNIAPTGVTYNGVAMTQIVNVVAGQLNNGWMFYLANPDTGNHDVVASFADSRLRELVIFTLQDTAQSSPVDVTGTVASGASATSATKEITTTVDGDLIISWLFVDSTPTGITDDAGQTSIRIRTGTDPQNAASEKAQTTAGAVSMGYTWTNLSPFDLYTTSIKYLAPTPEAVSAGEEYIIINEE